MDRQNFFPSGKLCISSVQKKEKGFEDYRYIAYLAASRLGFEVFRNPEDNVSTQKGFESTLQDDFPVFVLIIGEESSPMVSKEFNIALECCLPIFVFLKTQEDKISKKTQKNVKNISPSTYEYDCSKFENSEDLYNKVYDRLKQYITDNALKTSRFQKGAGLAYDINKRLLKKSKKQIIIYQRTSILILGPRKGVSNEIQFYKELTEWLHERSQNIEFLHVFNMEETVNEIKNNSWNYEDIEGAKENLNKLMANDRSKNNFPISIRYSKTNNPVSYVITDTNLVFVMPVETERYTLEMPANIMRASEIQILKNELYGATILKSEDVDKIYEDGLKL